MTDDKHDPGDSARPYRLNERSRLAEHDGDKLLIARLTAQLAERTTEADKYLQNIEQRQREFTAVVDELEALRQRNALLERVAVCALEVRVGFSFDEFDRAKDELREALDALDNAAEP